MTAWGITGVGAFAPDLVVGNDQIAAELDVDPDWIERYTGIRQRRRTPPAHASSDLAAEAARRALADAGRDIGEIGLIIVGTSTPDELGPSTACRVQALLGVRDIAVLDVGAACAGYLYGLRVARDWLAAESPAACALVIGVEVYTRFLDPRDRATAVLFGDGAGATVVSAVPDGYGIASVTLGADGTLADHVLIPAGGSRLPSSRESVDSGAHHITMDGRAVRGVMEDRFPRLVDQVLDDHELTLDDIDLLVPHQPNPRALQRFAGEIGLPMERVVIIGETLGNIGAASIPSALAEAKRNGRIKPGDRILAIAVGAGMTWGSALLRWAP
ncbi:ketoacyl-ACP synthase III [Phytomonospora sp. NPDC050363]|uniref:3-oxoacyl-ACP synthase III family protein n=1 Tax=Phytomonospora sp. NPDC050363 TaxID=3155642 RepID=UPI00340CF067